jgi:tetratricopeptide (TPR) repeat protein
MSEIAKRKAWFARNERAEEFEAEGKIQEALLLYEENAAEGCDIAYTYERMAALYRSQGRLDEEIEALEKALSIEEKRGPTGQMIRLQKRIETSKEVRTREGSKRGAPLRETSTGSTRVTSVKKKAKKGCLGVLVVLVGGGGILLKLLF